MIFYSYLFLMLWVFPSVLPENDCITQDFTVQMRTHLDRPDGLKTAFQSKNQIKVCFQSEVLSIFSGDVEKYSFDLPYIRRISGDCVFGMGSCSSGRRAGVRLQIIDGKVNWLRIEYPEYDFLHIFALNENEMENALFYTCGDCGMESEIAQFR